MKKEINLGDSSMYVEHARQVNVYSKSNIIVEHADDIKHNTEVITNSLPLQPSDFFRGRDEVIDKITEILVDDAKLLILNGMGGIGKTEVCRKIFRDAINNHLPGVEKVGWLTFHENLEQTLFGQFSNVDFDLNQPDEYMERIRNYLNLYSGTILLFIDNANDISEEDMAWLLMLKCKIIVTSRRRSLERIQPIEVGKLTINDCRILYRQHSEEYEFHEDFNYGITYEENDAPDEDLDEIIRLADRHTLAIELLAKTQKASGKNTAQMRNELETRQFSLSSISEPIYYHHNPENEDLNTNEQIFIEQFSKVLNLSGINGERLTIMQLFSLFTSEPVYTNYLKEWLELNDLSDVNSLVDMGWIFRGRIGNQKLVGYSMHPLISAVARYNIMPQYSKAKGVVHNLSQTLELSEADVFTSKLFAINHALSVISLLSGDDSDYADLINNAATILIHKSDLFKALEILEKGLDICDTYLGQNHHQVLIVYSNLGWIYNELSEYETALKWYDKNLQLSIQIYGEDHIEVAIAYNNIGNICGELGKFDRALELLQKALVVCVIATGEEDSFIATVYNNIGELYHKKGMYQEGLDWDYKALMIRKKILPPDHPDIAVSYNNIAAAYFSLGDFDEALRWYQKSLPIYEKVYGKEHPQTAVPYDNIGEVYMYMGQYEEAMKLYQKSLDINIKYFGTESFNVAQSYQYIADLYADDENYEKALEFFQRAITIKEKILGEHTSTALSYNNIAGIYDHLGEYQSALIFYEKALKINKNFLGEYHPSTAAIYNNMAVIHHRNERFNKAIKGYQKTLEIYKRTVGEEHPDNITILNNLASVYYMQKNLEKSLMIYLQAYRILMRKNETKNSTIEALLENMKVVYDGFVNQEQGFDEWLSCISVENKSDEQVDSFVGKNG